MHNRDVKLLEYLGRESEIEVFNQPERLLTLDGLFAAPCRCIDQDIGIEGMPQRSLQFLAGPRARTDPGQLIAR